MTQEIDLTLTTMKKTFTYNRIVVNLPKYSAIITSLYRDTGEYTEYKNDTLYSIAHIVLHIA